MLKQYRYWVIGLMLLLGLLGCSGSQSTAIPKGKKAQPSKSDKIIEDSFGHYRIYRRADKSYYVYKGGRIVYDRLRFVSHATLPGKNNMQALDQHNKLLTFSLYNSEMPQGPFCGNGISEYQMEISKDSDGFTLGLALTGGDVENFSAKTKKMLNKVHKIATVSSGHVDDLYFAKQQKKIAFSVIIDPKQSILYYTKANRYGVYGKLHANSQFKYWIARESPRLYDALEFVGEDVYVRSGVLWGCMGKTAVKYRKLSPFAGRLARFELSDGRRGYVTDKGVEYYD